MKLDYNLLDSGDGLLLEQFGNNKIVRPDSTAIWKPNNSVNSWNYDAKCTKDEFGKFLWQKNTSFKEPWVASVGVAKFELRFSNSKNVGLFPEQFDNWVWLHETLGAKKDPKILNLFAYTGAATLVSASAGASVTHVDAAKSVNSWAFRNAEFSGLADKPIRWLVDDCIKFMQREVKRGIIYDGIIMDPPAFGRADGVIFSFEKKIHDLLNLSTQLLKPKPLVFILNCYSMGYSPEVVNNLLLDYFPDQKIESGELALREKLRERYLSCSIFARFRNV